MRIAGDLLEHGRAAGDDVVQPGDGAVAREREGIGVGGDLAAPRAPGGGELGRVRGQLARDRRGQLLVPAEDVSGLMPGLVNQGSRPVEVLPGDLHRGGRRERAAVDEPKPCPENARSQPLVDEREHGGDLLAEGHQHLLEAAQREQVARAEQAGQSRRRARVDGVAVEVERRLDLDVLAAECDHALAEPVELGLRRRRRELRCEDVGLAGQAVGCASQLVAQREVEVLLQGSPGGRRGEVLEILQPDDRRPPVRDLSRDLHTQRFLLVSQSGTPRRW